jgi:Dehydrogenases with different specificities (related to short-chain alcohol dehydrogenases)
MAGQVAYCASKGGMVLMTKALAAELAPTVRVNCLAPGGIETPMTDNDFAVTDDPVGGTPAGAQAGPAGSLRHSRGSRSGDRVGGFGPILLRYWEHCLDGRWHDGGMTEIGMCKGPIYWPWAYPAVRVFLP